MVPAFLKEAWSLDISWGILSVFCYLLYFLAEFRNLLPFSLTALVLFIQASLSYLEAIGYIGVGTIYMPKKTVITLCFSTVFQSHIIHAGLSTGFFVISRGYWLYRSRHDIHAKKNTVITLCYPTTGVLF